VAQVIENLSRKCEALSLNASNVNFLSKKFVYIFYLLSFFSLHFFHFETGSLFYLLVYYSFLSFEEGIFGIFISP
jgi:hypothetical protein